MQKLLSSWRGNIHNNVALSGLWGHGEGCGGCYYRECVHPIKRSYFAPTCSSEPLEDIHFPPSIENINVHAHFQNTVGN